MVKVGDVVTYIDELSQERNALVTCVHSQDYINLIIVTNDLNKTDGYGQQTEHVSSVGRLAEFNKAGRHFIEK
jgi:hypothetical protein